MKSERIFSNHFFTGRLSLIPPNLIAMDVTIGNIFPIFQFFKLALKDAEDNSLQLFYRNICSKMNNKVTKR
jgi:hypothetical protein